MSIRYASITTCLSGEEDHPRALHTKGSQNWQYAYTGAGACAAKRRLRRCCTLLASHGTRRQYSCETLFLDSLCYRPHLLLPSFPCPLCSLFNCFVLVEPRESPIPDIGWFIHTEMLFLLRTSTILVLLNLAVKLIAQSPTTLHASSTISQAPQTHTVSVAKGSFAYEPDSIQARPGDLVVFQFFPSNHSVIRAAYGYPCVPYEDVSGPGAVGFYSGHFIIESIPVDVCFPLYFH